MSSIALRSTRAAQSALRDLTKAVGAGCGVAVAGLGIWRGLLMTAAAHPSFAPCIVQQNLPASIGGGKVPYVPADPATRSGNAHPKILLAQTSGVPSQSDRSAFAAY